LERTGEPFCHIQLAIEETSRFKSAYFVVIRRSPCVNRVFPLVFFKEKAYICIRTIKELEL
jgi:hypothetical protein